MTLKRGLGRGIDALIPREEAAPDGSGEDAEGNKPRSAELFIPLEKLKANPEQPRKNFDHGELAELADSIREHGVIQPIIVEEREDGTYTIVAGERRTRAAKIAGLTEIPALVRKYSDEKRMAVSLIENIQRSGLNPMEEALAYKRLMELTGLSQDEAAARVGKNRSTVANALRLLKLPYEMQESIQEGDLSPGHARAILSIPGAKGQDLLFREILKKNLSVREAERRAAVISGEAKKTAQPRERPSRAPELDAMEEKFITRLGTKVAINGDLNKGSIVIDYYSMEDL
ncbi:MAG: ParB/RepB/Spo0J family partition protein, partial [Treponema sp.]|nr:ParB/RepB/Spo0J family partition protein [Treponema sp.]